MHNNASVAAAIKAKTVKSKKVKRLRKAITGPNKVGVVVVGEARVET